MPWVDLPSTATMHVHVAVDQATTNLLNACICLSWPSNLPLGVLLTSILMNELLSKSYISYINIFTILYLQLWQARNLPPWAPFLEAAGISSQTLATSQKKQATSLQLRTTVSTSIKSTLHFLDGSKCTFTCTYIQRTHTANTFQKKRHLSSSFFPKQKKIKQAPTGWHRHLALNLKLPCVFWFTYLKMTTLYLCLAVPNLAIHLLVM